MPVISIKTHDGFAPARRALWNPLSHESVIRAALDVLSESNDPADIALVREHRMRLFAQPGAELNDGALRTAEACFQQDFGRDYHIPQPFDFTWLDHLLWRALTHTAAFVAGIAVCAHVGGLL